MTKEEIKELLQNCTIFDLSAQDENLSKFPNDYYYVGMSNTNWGSDHWDCLQLFNMKKRKFSIDKLEWGGYITSMIGVYWTMNACSHPSPYVFAFKSPTKAKKFADLLNIITSNGKYLLDSYIISNDVKEKRKAFEEYQNNVSNFFDIWQTIK